MSAVAPAEVLVLVVEDEMLVASALEMVLLTSGYRVLGPAATVSQASALMGRETPQVALIDFRLASSTTESLLEEFRSRGVQTCVISGYSKAQLPRAYQDCLVLAKPFSMEQVIQAIRTLCAAREATHSPEPPAAT